MRNEPRGWLIGYGKELTNTLILLADANAVIEAQQEEYEMLEERVQQVEENLQRERGFSRQQQQEQRQQYEEAADRRARTLANLLKRIKKPDE